MNNNNNNKQYFYVKKQTLIQSKSACPIKYITLIYITLQLM